MFASSPVGFNHPYFLENKAQLTKASLNKLALSDIYSEEFADFVEAFERVAMPKELSYAFFIEGGGLAVENALKAAFDWKTKLNFAKGIDKEAGKVIHFKEAFHGRTGYTLSLTNTKDPRKYMHFPKFDWPRIINPKLQFPLNEEHVQEAIKLEKEAIDQILAALKKYPDEIACLILEPIQAEGGDNHFRKEFFKELRNICDEYEILLIFDEVQTGLGMTGKMWAYQHYDILPDIISFGKKSQVCGIMANRSKFDQVKNHVFVESSRLNSTFGGNLVDMVRFKLILEIFEKEKIVERSAILGKYLLDNLFALSSRKSEISNIRGLGLMVAFDLPSAAYRDQFIKKAFDHKLLFIGCGERSIRFRPHLTVSNTELDTALAIIANIIYSENRLPQKEHFYDS